MANVGSQHRRSSTHLDIDLSYLELLHLRPIFLPPLVGMLVVPKP